MPLLSERGNIDAIPKEWTSMIFAIRSQCHSYYPTQSRAECSVVQSEGEEVTGVDVLII